MSRLKIFIVEDDEWYREYLNYTLSLNPDHHVTVFSNGKDCVQHLDESPDVVTVDFGLPDMTGADLLQQIKKS
jgi:DNA-binding response OmpR family regulator